MNVSQTVYDALWQEWGAQNWWPATSHIEIMIGAILTQNTSWTQVEKVIQRLKEEKTLDIQTLASTPSSQLELWVKPAGYYRQKSSFIRSMCRTLIEKFKGSTEDLFLLETRELRNELLSWKGIGPETADSILLYAAHRPVFVIDAYTRRFMTRHGWSPENEPYEQMAKRFTNELETDSDLYNEYHALIVRLGKTYCRSKPACQSCPLQFLLTRPVSV
jgi:endonuclease-3 related protein